MVKRLYNLAVEMQPVLDSNAVLTLFYYYVKQYRNTYIWKAHTKSMYVMVLCPLFRPKTISLNTGHRYRCGLDPCSVPGMSYSVFQISKSEFHKLENNKNADDNNNNNNTRKNKTKII